jgi:transcriptional regulator with XRE-family HTH domain
LNSIGQRLRQERERLGKTQPQFAALAGCTKRSQLRYEADEVAPDATYLAALANAGVDVQFVLLGIEAEARQRLDLLDHAVAIAGQANEPFDDNRKSITRLHHMLLAWQKLPVKDQVQVAEFAKRLAELGHRVERP